MSKEKEPNKKQNIFKGIPQGGIEDPRFETPVMAINMTTDSVQEKYQQHLKDGGDRVKDRI